MKLNSTKPLVLSRDEIGSISSPYLAGGRKQESWQIDRVEVYANRLSGAVSMTQFVTSPTDQNEFHLSFLTALEFVSQLQIIYMHCWANLPRKTQEVWMVEHTLKSIRPIVNHELINVEMKVEKIRRAGEKQYCAATHQVSDDRGGLFEIWIKALMA